MTKNNIPLFEYIIGDLYPTARELKAGMNTSAQYISMDPVEAKILISSALAFYTGIIQVTKYYDFK